MRGMLADLQRGPARTSLSCMWRRGPIAKPRQGHRHDGVGEPNISMSHTITTSRHSITLTIIKHYGSTSDSHPI